MQLKNDKCADSRITIFFERTKREETLVDIISRIVKYIFWQADKTPATAVYGFIMKICNARIHYKKAHTKIYDGNIFENFFHIIIFLIRYRECELSMFS